MPIGPNVLNMAVFVFLAICQESPFHALLHAHMLISTNPVKIFLALWLILKDHVFFNT